MTGYMLSCRFDVECFAGDELYLAFPQYYCSGGSLAAAFEEVESRTLHQGIGPGHVFVVFVLMLNVLPP